MPEIQNPEIVRKIERRYGIRGYPGPGVLAPEIVPVSIVDSLDEEKTQRMFVAGYPEVAVAAKYTSVQLYNPANSGVILFVSKIWIAPEADNQPVIVALSRNSENPFTGTSRAIYDTGDTRYGSGTSGAKLYSGNAVAPVGYNYYAKFDTDQQLAIDLPYVLVPDTGVYVQHQTAVKALTVNFLWFERAYEVDDDLS